MFKYGLAILPVVFFLSCKDTPYEETKPVQETEKASYEFNGVVEVGTPISGATVTAYQFSGLKKGEKIAEALTNRDGTYKLSFKSDYNGPLLLASNGGIYRDLVNGENVAVKPSQELRSAITHIKMPEKTNINAWTTLAVARVLADRGFWDKSVADLKDIDRINVDFSHMSYFLSGKTTNFVNIRRQEFFDVEKEPYKPEDAKVTLHLAHGGLSQIASDFSARLASEGIIVSVFDLLSALSGDLSDRVFDGRNAQGETIYVGNNHRINLSSYTMRKELSEAIRLYSRRLQSLGRITEEDSSVLEMPGRLVDYLSSDSRPELFPEAEQPKPIDREAPDLRVRFAYKHSGENPFAFLQGDVSFDVQVHDETKVKAVEMLEPQKIDMRSAGKFGPIGVDHEPQAMQAAEACGMQDYLKNEIANKQWSLANIVCACFRATDVFNNARKELACFQRELLKPLINFPTDQTVLSSKNFKDGVKVKAKVTSGLPLKECAWRIQDRLDSHGEDDVLPRGNGVIEGTSCVIDEPLDGSKFLNGNYYLVLTAKDMAERVLSDKYDGIYSARTNFHVLTEPPAVEITSPANNEFVATNYIRLKGKVENAELIKEAVVRFKHFESGREGDALVSLAKDKKDWSAILGSNLEAGIYAISLTVKDIHGNEKQYQPKTVTLDHQLPVILGAREGVSQTPYLQETTNYRQRFVNDPANPHYEIEPIGEAAPITWSRTPIIHRWSTRLDDSNTAPRYTFRVSDDHQLKEVKYKFNYKCSTLEESDRVAIGQENRYDIWLVQHNASFDLSRDSEADGHLQRYCLSIWGIDKAGNAQNHNVEFIWKVVSPPIAIDMNSGNYRAHRFSDDITYVGKPMWELFRNGNPIKLRRNTVIGHAILANPHNAPVSTKLELLKPIPLSLSSGKHAIPEREVDIVYQAYDLKTEQAGPVRNLIDNTVVINAHETILAKIAVIKDFPITGIDSPNSDFWKTFNLEVAFVKAGDKKQLVDGLRLISSEPNVKSPRNDFAVPWGESHNVRRRFPPRFGG